SLNQTEKIDHEVQASACRIESLSEQWLTFQMNEFSPYLGMTPSLSFDRDVPDKGEAHKRCNACGPLFCSAN
ncbi:hypothetical protein, partial [Pseudomonas aeruginosa]|uniref:hypothetical protein n=1 Tax=Pseudomonas aeruginosa TaxID=287 RepID=UPI001F2F9A5B